MMPDITTGATSGSKVVMMNTENELPGNETEAELVDDQTADSSHPEKKDTRLAKFDPVQAGLEKLTKLYSAGPPADLSVPENYEACRLACAEMRKKRTRTEKIRKELKADVLEYGRKVDSVAKKIIDHITALEEPYATAKKNHDTAVEVAKREAALAEERRVDGIASRIAGIGALVTAHVSSSSEVIGDILHRLGTDLETCDEWGMEFADKARSTIAETSHKLHELHAMKVQQERFAAEIARAEKEAAEKAEADRLQREKDADLERERLATEREKLAAEQAEIERLRKEQQAEFDRQRAEQQAEIDRQRKALQDEQDRIAAEQLERAAQAERELQAAVQAEKDEKEREENEARQIRDRLLNIGWKEDQPAPPQIAPADQASENYREAGRAIKAITNDFQMAKAILDSIINGEIPHITYTGANA